MGTEAATAPESTCRGVMSCRRRFYPYSASRRKRLSSRIPGCCGVFELGRRVAEGERSGLPREREAVAARDESPRT